MKRAEESVVGLGADCCATDDTAINAHSNKRAIGLDIWVR
jgi:hypothetical protein